MKTSTTTPKHAPQPKKPTLFSRFLADLYLFWMKSRGTVGAVIGVVIVSVAVLLLGVGVTNSIDGAVTKERNERHRYLKEKCEAIGGSYFKQDELAHYPQCIIKPLKQDCDSLR